MPELKFQKRAQAAGDQPKPSLPEGRGKVLLHTTKRGRPVYASGAESDGYTDDDHAEAGAVHAKVHAHHEIRATLHTHARDGDDDWRRSEEHHAESERHRGLADHHHELARHHLTVAGRGASVGLGMDQAGKPSLSDVQPFSERERLESRRALKKRTHHDHPGTCAPQDRQAYQDLLAQRRGAGG